MHSTELIDAELLERRVQDMYRAVADDPGGDFHFEMGQAVALRLGYDPQLLDAAPPAAVESFAGVGHFFDMAGLQPGETVVDLGSGSGPELFLAALQVGEQGHVTGIDITDAQLAKARRLAGEHGFANVELVEGRL